jgi:hypothetical protein
VTMGTRTMEMGVETTASLNLATSVSLLEAYLTAGKSEFVVIS